MQPKVSLVLSAATLTRHPADPSVQEVKDIKTFLEIARRPDAVCECRAHRFESHD